VKLHGLLTTGMDFSDDTVELAMPDGACEKSALFDPRALLAIVAGVKIPLDHVLQEGEQVDLYLPFGGG
jgi:hypothetical protein